MFIVEYDSYSLKSR